MSLRLSFSFLPSCSLLSPSLPLSLSLSPSLLNMPPRESTSGPHPVSLSDLLLLPTPHARLRLFYPTPSSDSPRAPWFPHSPTFPDETLIAYLKYAGISFPSFFSCFLFSLPTKPLPASLNAPVSDAEFPLVIFSHGLAGGLAAYCSICCEIASWGFIVAAVEHTDGSAVTAFVGEQRKQVDYIHFDSKIHDKGFRKGQLCTRVKDLQAVIAAMRKSATGDHHVFRPLNGGELPDFQGRIGEHVYLVGHSFGAATCLEMANGHVDGLKAVVCLDAWLEAVGKERISAMEIDASVIFVDMGASDMKQSLAIRAYIADNPGGHWRDAVAVVSGLHNNSSDFAMRLPYPAATALRMTAKGSDPARILDKQNHAVVSVLRGEWAAYRSGVATGEVEGVRLADMGKATVLL